MNLKGGSWGLLVETMLNRKSLIYSNRIAFGDKSELVGTRAILEERTLLRGNFDHFYYFLDFFLVFWRLLVETKLIRKSTTHSIKIYQNHLERDLGRSWTNRKHPADQHVTDHFRKNSYFSEILETTWITMQKSPLSVPGLSPEKPLAEILSLKKLTSTFKF